MRLNQTQAGIDLDYNGYSGENADLHVPSGYTMMTLSSWQSALTAAPGFSSNDAHSITFADPLFVNVPTNPTGNHTQYDFHLRAGSPAVDAGGPLTRVIGSGSGTTVKLVDAGYFMDGYGITVGDLVQIGSQLPARIISVNYSNNTITVDRSLSWNDGDGVSLPYLGDAPDLGAFEMP